MHFVEDIHEERWEITRKVDPQGNISVQPDTPGLKGKSDWQERMGQAPH